MKEAEILINGNALIDAQSIVIRIAIESFSRGNWHIVAIMTESYSIIVIRAATCQFPQLDSTLSLMYPWPKIIGNYYEQPSLK